MNSALEDPKVLEIIDKLNSITECPYIEIDERARNYLRWITEANCRIEPEDICVYVLKHSREEPDYLTTIINLDYFFFKKSDLVKLIQVALEGRSQPMTIQGKRVIDEVVWEDGLAGGPCWGGPKASDVLGEASLDISKEPPVLLIKCQMKYLIGVSYYDENIPKEWFVIQSDRIPYNSSVCDVNGKHIGFVYRTRGFSEEAARKVEAKELSLERICWKN